MKSNPKITIIIPVYNAIKYLQACLDSILVQNFTDWECVIVDDGSSDGSGSICDIYSERDRRFTVFHQENCGVSCARNLGIINSNGKWITFVDADDYLLPQSIESLYQAAIDNYSDFVYGNTIRRDGIKDNHVISNLKDQSWINDYGMLAHFGLWGCLFKSEIIKKGNNFFVEGLAYGEDMIFKLIYLKYVRKITTISAPVYIYRVNLESVTNSSNKVRSAHHQLVATKYLIDLAKLEKNNPCYKKTLLKTIFSSRRQIYCDVAYNPIRNDRIEIIKDYYRILGSSFFNIVQLYYNVWKLRLRRGIKSLLLK